jgi:cytochrome c oxidase subunit 2
MTPLVGRLTKLNIVARHEDNSFPGVVVLINLHKSFSCESQGYPIEKSIGHRAFNYAVRFVGIALLMILICAPTANSASPRRVEVVAKRFAFEPAEITLKKGEAIDFVLTSKDVAHGVRIRELNLDLNVGKGKTADVTLTPTVTGTFVGHCSVFCGAGHGQMTLTIHVVA